MPQSSRLRFLYQLTSPQDFTVSLVSTRIMKFSTAVLALAAATLPVFAVPTAEPEPVVGAELVEREAAGDLEKRSNGIYVCAGT